MEFICINLYHNGSNSFLFVSATKIYQFEVKSSAIKDYTLRLGNISKDFTNINLEKNAGLGGIAKLLSIDFNPIDTNNILDIHKYLMKSAWYKIMLEII